MVEERTRVFVGGSWVEPTGDVVEVISPHTEQPVGTVVTAGPADVDRAVAAARAAFDEGPWPRTSPA